MKAKFYSVFIKCILHPKGICRVCNISLLTIFMFLVYLFVYQSGGTKYVFTHTMYIPIILSSITFGVTGGIFFGVIAGLLLGPLMPLDTNANEPQVMFNWLYRMYLFLIIGIISGVSSNLFRKNNKTIINLLTYNQETGLPNINTLDSNILNNVKTDENNVKLVVSILINNYENIIDLIGRNRYINLIKNINLRIKAILPEDIKIIHADTNKLWICLDHDNDEFISMQILNTLNNNFFIDDIPLYVEFTLGSIRCDANLRLIDCFNRSDAAAHYAQKINIQYLIYNQNYIKNKTSIELLGMFREALYLDQLDVHYQPKMDLRTNKTIGFEALLRWNHSTRGMISPAELIPIVEETQLITPLTEWVLQKTLKTLQKFQKNQINTTISINISTKNLHHPHFLESVINLINEHNIEANSVELEITESALMENPETSNYLLHKLKDYQIGLSIDDYGKGYSSLSYLSNFPIHIVKIDQYFIREMLEDNGINHIVKSTIDLVHNLGKKVVAEGVETEEIAKSLIEMGCDMAQGYFYAKPMKETEIMAWYQNNI